MSVCFLDLETYCDVPIRDGTYVYAQSAEIMLFAWAIDDGPVQVWDCTFEEDMPVALERALDDESVLICAQNSMFDRNVLEANGINTTLTRWRDTMVRALAHSLPGALGALSEIMELAIDKRKDKAGKALVQLFCKPRPKTTKIRRATAHTHPEQWAQFIEYARLDVEAMRVLYHKLPEWNYRDAELALWHLDQRINDRGVQMDLELARAAVAAVTSAKKQLAERTMELTEGEVSSTTKGAALLRHLLEAYGIDLPDLQMSTLERRVQDPELPAELRELLANRLQASSTSASKYQTLLRGVSPDGRLRGLLQFCGASRTGRWAGRMLQPQNMSRQTMRSEEIEVAIAALLAGCLDLIHE